MNNHHQDNDRAMNRAAFVGTVAAVLVGAGAFTGPSFDGPPIVDAQAAVDAYVNDTGAVLTSAIIGLLGVPALLWFAGIARWWLEQRTESDSPLPSIAFGGVIGGAVSLAVGNVIVISQALRAQDATVDPNVLVSMDDLSTHMFGVAAPLCFSALVGAVAIASLRGSTQLPRPVAIASIVLAALMLVPPVAWIGMLLFLIWLVGVSINVAVREPAPTHGRSGDRGTVPA